MSIDSIGDVHRKVVKAYRLDDSHDLAVYFGKTDLNDCKYINIKTYIDKKQYKIQYSQV